MNAAITCRTRGAKYFEAELLNIFGVMETVLPIGPIEWDAVLAAHSSSFPGKDVHSLRRKYTTTHRKKIPTGSLNMPPEVQMVKQVKYLVGGEWRYGMQRKNTL